MNKKFLSNTAWIIGGQIIKNVLGFVVSILTASYLGPSNYGIIGYVASIILLFTSISNLGLGNIVVKEIIIHKGYEGDVIGTAITMQTISSFISYGLVILTVSLLNINNDVMLVCASLQGIGLIISSFDHIKYYYQSKLESKYPTIIALFAYILVQIYKIILLYFKKSVEWFAFANTLDYLVIAVSIIVVYMLGKNPKWRFNATIAKSLLKQSVPFILTGLVSVLYVSLDKIMLKEILNSTEPVGYYNVAHTISSVWIFIVSAIITSYAPLIYESANIDGIDSDNYKLRLRQMYCIVFWFGIAASICINIVGPFLIPWAYQGKFNQSIPPTMILTWASIFAYLGVARGIQFVCENKQKTIIFFSILTVIINASMNSLLIPILEVTGAAIATLISEFFVCIIAPMLFKKTRNISFTVLQGMAFYKVNIKSIWNTIKVRVFKRIDNKSNEILETNESDNILNKEEYNEDIGEKENE